jgi:hypothetical protein
MPENKEPTPQEKSEKEDVIKQTKAEALTPDQKHKNYLDDIERLHNEP